MKELKVMVAKRFSIDFCKKNKNCLFIYGNNRASEGLGGTAVIRNEQNSYGISTKHKPSNDKDAFYTDEEYEDNIRVFEEELNKIDRYAEEIGVDTLVFPYGGLGNGLALLGIKAPKTYFYMCTRLYDKWKYNNVEGIISVNS